MIRKIIVGFAILVSGSSMLSAQETVSELVYLDESKPIEDRVEDALKRMTLEEKVALCHAQSKFSSPGVSRLGLPENWTTDGPHGIRPEVLWDEWDQASWTNDSCIAFPALTALAATWNKDMSKLYGKVIGEEARYRNKNILLGPGVNIYRTPLNGRNFEYMGEDPFLAAELVVPYVQGVQENGVAACVKHFALNNQEIDRHTVNVDVDDRTLYEIYLPAFKAAVQKGKAWAIMGAYNKYKNQWACQNEYLLNDILRGEWGFDGVVISDWGGVNDTKQAIYNGLDMEFGTWTDGLSSNVSNAYDNYYLANPFLELLKSGEVSEEEVNKKARNILRMMYRTNMNKNRPYGSFGTKEHANAGKEIAEEGIVLLKNDKNLLPINLNKVNKIAVIGENALKMMTIGGGSSQLKAKYEVSPLEGIKNRVKDKAEVIYARGYTGANLGAQDGLKVKEDIEDNRTPAELIAEAVKVAKSADVVIYVGGLNKNPGQDCEGEDRKSLNLPYNQDVLISALAKANPNLVIVNISGNAVAMPWVDEVSAIIQGWYLGTEAGNALASVLMGDTNPSGKLPFTFPKKIEDVGANKVGEYPGNGETKYNEGIFVGYRWADKEKLKPLFPFGHGLSYTSFAYGKGSVNKKTMNQDDIITFSVDITNTGKVEGAEVLQLYIHDNNPKVPRPLKELKGFEKVNLKPGETKNVTFDIDKTALSYFDADKHEWVAEPGDFEAWIGSSSADIKTKIPFKLVK